MATTYRKLAEKPALDIAGVKVMTFPQLTTTQLRATSTALGIDAAGMSRSDLLSAPQQHFASGSTRQWMVNRVEVRNKLYVTP